MIAGWVQKQKFKFQTNLVATSSMKRKRNVEKIETKLDIIDQLAKGVRGSSLAAHYSISIIQSSEKIDYPNNPKSQLRSLDNTGQQIFDKLCLS